MPASNDLRRDLLALRRHLWFVVLIFLLSLAAAAASLLVVPSSNEARFRAGVTLSSLPPLFGPDTLPTTDDFARLATSPEALERTSQALIEEGFNTSAEELGGKLSAEARRGQTAIDFTVKDDDSDLALTIARAWSGVFAQLAPEKAPDLERQATLPYQAQLERAEEELKEKRQAVADLGGTTASADEAGTTPATQFGALGADYQAKAEALAAREIEQAEVQNTLDVLRAAATGGTSLSADQLRLLLTAILPADTLLGQSLTAENAAAALELRLVALASSIASLAQELQELESTLGRRSSDLERAISELRAAEENYQVASRLAQSYQVVGDLLTMNVTILRKPHLGTAGKLDWLARLGAAAAFAAVVGVLGALALDQISGRGRRSAPAGNPRPNPQAPTGSPSLTPTPKWPRATTNPHGPGRSRDLGRRLSFGGTALAVILLIGVLGTMTRRRRQGRRS